MNKKRIAFILITIIYMAGICIVSLRSGPKTHGSGMAMQILNNFLHIPVYGLLSYLILNCFSSISLKSYVSAFFLALIFGVLNEFFQAFTPDRTVSFMDIALNMVGIISFLSISYFSGKTGSQPIN